MNSKSGAERKIEHNAKVGAVAKADKAWTDYAQLTPENRDARKLAELWSQKEQAKAELKKLTKYK